MNLAVIKNDDRVLDVCLQIVGVHLWDKLLYEFVECLHIKSILHNLDMDDPVQTESREN
jgi:hypothetical protein